MNTNFVSAFTQALAQFATVQFVTVLFATIQLRHLRYAAKKV
ncbi:hypothetical protein [Shewanella sp. SM96]|nr:hypothetical protein [Shewanella sp. SM96]